jgi:hypothetical protein
MPRHAIILEPMTGLSFGERWGLDAGTAILWPLNFDQRITVLVNLLAAQLESDTQAEAVGDMLKMSVRQHAQNSR